MKEILSSRTLLNHNAFTVLKTIRDAGKISRADTSRILNCSRSAVSSIIEYLENLNLLIEAGSKQPHTGRSARLLQFNGRAQYLLSCALTPEKLSMGLVDLDGNVTHDSETQVNSTCAGEIMDLIVMKSKKLINLCRKNNQPLSFMGLSIPGIINSKDGIVLYSSPLKWVHPVYMGKVLEDNVGISVSVENDANGMALAESWCGAAKDHDDYLYVLLGRKIGGAVIANHSIISGKNWTSGEFGKMNVYYKGKSQRLEECYSLSNNEEKISLLAQLTANLQTSFDPELIIWNGGGEKLGACPLLQIETEARKYLPSAPHKKISLTESLILKKKTLLGAAAAALAHSPYCFILGGKEI